MQVGGDDNSHGAFLILVLFLVLTGYLVYKLVVQDNNNEILRTLQRTFTFRQEQGGDDRRRPSGGRSRLQRSHSERLSDVASTIQKLPVELYHTEEELNQMRVAELKDLMRKARIECGSLQCVEKPDLVRALMSGTNSTAESCSICCEDYVAGDVLRVLRCGHRYHIECIDKWFLTSTDYSRPVACPVCNSEVEPLSDS